MIAAETTRPEPTSLLARQLTVRLRPEFSVGAIVPHPDDEILGVRLWCAGLWPAAGGSRAVHSHNSRWRRAGYPDREGWMAVTDPASRGPPPTAGLRGDRLPAGGAGDQVDLTPT